MLSICHFKIQGIGIILRGWLPALAFLKALQIENLRHVNLLGAAAGGIRFLLASSNDLPSILASRSRCGNNLLLPISPFPVQLSVR